MLLDGSQLEVGDSVYHLTLGKGIVETIEKGTARVKMNAGGGIKNMSENGYLGGEKVFFWSKPVVVVPKKGESEQATRLATVLRQLLDLTE